VLQTISLISSYLPIVFFVAFCIKKAPKEMWVIFIFCLISIFFDLFLTHSSFAFKHKYFIWNLFSIVEYIFITYFFYIIIKRRLIRVLILVFSFFYLLIFLLNSKTDNTQFDSVLSAIKSFAILGLSLSYILNIMKPTTEPVKIFTPVFLIVVGLLLFVSSTLFLFIIANRLSEKEMNQYWSINYYANILVSFIFSAAFLLFYFQQKSKSPESQSVDYTSPNDR
jgi:drug/metabolite transporter (DMT)-like permease